MTQPLLLDEMFSDTIARQLRDKAHDVVSVVADPALVSAKTFPQSRSYMANVTSALAAFLDKPGGLPAAQVVFLARA
jgi:hypothetical protein